jgi:hypothetical protein
MTTLVAVWIPNVRGRELAGILSCAVAAGMDIILADLGDALHEKESCLGRVT